MLSDFDKLVKRRRDLQAWWALGSTIAAYDHGVHKLRVVVQSPSMVAYCGQAYAGAKNYHEAPEWFAEAVRQELSAQAAAITKAAYESEMARLTSEIERNRQAVLAELQVGETA